MNSFDLCVIDLEESLDKLKKFRNKFNSAISTKTRNLEQQSLQYLQGILLEKGRGNMINYAKQVPNTNNQVLQNFISDSPWDEKPVIDLLQKEVIQLIADNTTAHSTLMSQDSKNQEIIQLESNDNIAVVWVKLITVKLVFFWDIPMENIEP
jgi:hypothetical protein